MRAGEIMKNKEKVKKGEKVETVSMVEVIHKSIHVVGR